MKKNFYVFFSILIFYFFCYGEIHFGITSAVKTVIKKIKLPTQKENSSPFILELKTDSQFVFVEKDIVIICIASDPDEDVLTYEWFCSSGTLSSVSDRNDIIRWTAPPSSGTYSITCKVTDPKGAFDEKQIDILVKFNHFPILTFTEENGFENDAVNPDSGSITTVFEFRIKYIDYDGDLPMSGYPKLYIKKSGENIYGSPFVMNLVSGEPTNGCFYSKTYNYPLLPGNDYTYYFEVEDQHGAYTKTQELQGPTILDPLEKKEVDKSTTTKTAPSIATDGSNNPHIVYYDSENSVLKYAYFDGQLWHISTIDTAFFYSNIAIDSSDTIHISYCSNGALKYAKKQINSSSWQIQTIDTGSVGYYNSIAVDLEFNVHISYYDLSNQDLKYAIYDGISWSTYTVDSTGNVGAYTSIVVDSSKNVHISYCDLTNKTLKYANYNGVIWSTYTVSQPTEEEVAHTTSITLDPNNRVWIAYYNSKNAEVNLRNWFETGSFSGWGKQTIENNVSSCESLSFKFDLDGIPCIVYSTKGILKFAKKISGSWWIFTIDNDSGLYYASLAIDKQNVPHISFCNLEKKSLNYAKWIEK